jgi:plasmid stabilization system protein ParE
LKPLQITDPAEVELAEATAWYRDRDPRVASRFTAEVRRALELIERFPQIGERLPSIEDPGVRRMPIHHFPYHVVFVELPARVEVVAFAHYRRNPTYFLNRLRRA